MSRSSMDNIWLGTSIIDKELASGAATLTGDKQKFNELTGLLVSFNPLFNIVTP